MVGCAGSARWIRSTESPQEPACGRIAACKGRLEDWRNAISRSPIGHFLGLFFELPYIGTQMCSEGDTFHASAAIGIEAFVTKSGVGSSGIEQNFIVHEDHNEIISKTPMIWW
jgi:hypothetical protein